MAKHSRDQSNDVEEQLRKAKKYLKKQEISKKLNNSSSSDDSGSHKKKSKKRKNSSHKKSKKSSKHQDKDKKSSKSNSPPPTVFKISLGPITNKHPTTLLTPDDYFTYNEHLRVFVFRNSSGTTSLSDLSTEASHDSFASFCKKYNKGKLESMYYSNKLSDDVINECKRTVHTWGFKTSTTEVKALELLKAGIKTQTEYNVKQPSSKRPAAGGGSSSSSRAQVMSRPTTSPSPAICQPINTTNNRAAKTRLAVHGNEEIYGVEKKEGFERSREKKQEVGNSLHGASRDKEELRAGGVELSDNDIYGGGGGGDFKDMLARKNARNSAKNSAKSEKMASLMANEDKRKTDMLKMLGLSDLSQKGKITIAPR